MLIRYLFNEIILALKSNFERRSTHDDDSLSCYLGQQNAYAGLALTAQLVTCLSFYLDVILPKKVGPADFMIKSAKVNSSSNKNSLVRICVLLQDYRGPYVNVHDFRVCLYFQVSSFVKSLNKLNTNVLFLCFSQYVPHAALHPTQTIHNIQMLLNTTGTLLNFILWKMFHYLVRRMSHVLVSFFPA